VVPLSATAQSFSNIAFIKALECITILVIEEKAVSLKLITLLDRQASSLSNPNGLLFRIRRGDSKEGAFLIW
jgi:hypothetical protein